jgi:hypothetical protein
MDHDTSRECAKLDSTRREPEALIARMRAPALTTRLRQMVRRPKLRRGLPDLLLAPISPAHSIERFPRGREQDFNAKVTKDTKIAKKIS